jgi:prephenate dehydrogenase
VVVLVPDRPGELARLLHDVGDAGVILVDLLVVHGLGQPFGLAEISVLPAVAERLAEELQRRGWRLHG